MKFCLLGKKLPYSFSKEIHTLNGFDYDLCEVEEEDNESLPCNIEDNPSK